MICAMDYSRSVIHTHECLPSTNNITDYLIYANTGIPNLDSAILMKLIIKNLSHSTLHIGYEVEYIEQTVKAKFLGYQINK
jgi:hypothetical protein